MLPQNGGRPPPRKGDDLPIDEPPTKRPIINLPPSATPTQESSRSAPA